MYLWAFFVFFDGHSPLGFSISFDFVPSRVFFLVTTFETAACAHS